MSGKQTAYQSVTKLTGPIAMIGDLHPDLLAAFNLAVFFTTHCKLLTWAAAYSGRPRQGGREDEWAVQMVGQSVRLIGQELPHADVLQAVFNELAVASEPGRRFGSASAHEAASSVAVGVYLAVWIALDPSGSPSWFGSGLRPDPDVGRLADRFQAVRESLASRTWPSWDELIVALKVEAAKAAVSRGTPTPRRKHRKQGVGVQIHARLLSTIQSHPERLPALLQRSAADWASEFGCSKSVVIESPAWKSIEKLREEQKTDRFDAQRPAARRR